VRGALAAAVVALALIAAPAHAATVFKCAMGTINDVQHEWCKRFIARLEKASNGLVTGQVFPAGQLGSTSQLVQAVQLGTIEAVLTPPEFLIGLEPRFMVLTSPYLFDGMDHAHRVLNDKEFRDRFTTLAEPKGVIGVSLFVYGPAGIALRTPLRGPDDVKGKKLRINATPIERAMMSALGASGVPMGLGEALTAIQQGTVDGVQSALPAVANLKFYESAKYYATTNHFFITSMAFVNKRWLDALPPAVKQAALDEGRAIQPEILDVAKEKIAAAETTWKQGSKDGWIDLTADERQAFRNRLEGVDSRVIQENPAVKDLVEFLRRKSKELR
jgi:TRAP-type C4-dicarboxylate transport system substrate-binding protein